MKIGYISPSILPSRFANSIHVVHQSLALQELGHEVELFAVRKVLKDANLVNSIGAFYGVRINGIKLSTIFWPITRLGLPMLAIFGFLSVLFRGQYDLVISRNALASFMFSFFRINFIVVEVHNLEGGMSGWFLKQACLGRNVQVVCISNALKRDLIKSFGKPLRTVEVLHDAAPLRENLTKQGRTNEKQKLKELTGSKMKFSCAYVGHLYRGRGIEVILEIAKELDDINFYIIGGNEDDIKRFSLLSDQKNIFFLGHVRHDSALAMMEAVDLLLMPYQKRVSIGIKGHDTSQWMSPMKMFEYMSAGRAIVASNLPVLKEVLKHEKNAFLVPTKDVNSWIHAIKYLRENPVIRKRIGLNAQLECRSKYTWINRAKSLVELVSNET